MSNELLDPVSDESAAQEDPQQPGLWYRFRRSNTLIISVVFVALGLEVALSTTLEPILPCLLLEGDTGQDCRAVDSGQANVTLPTINYAGDGGIIIGIKNVVEVFAKPLCGIVIDRFGHRRPLLFGSIITVFATLGFAFLSGMPMLMLSRSLQGLGCSLTTVAGIAMLAEVYTDDNERSKAMAKAFGGYAVGVMFGFPFGSFTYQFFGKEMPFLILAFINVLDAIFRVIIVAPEKLVQPSSLGAWKDYKELLTDPYLILGFGYTIMYTLGIGASLAIVSPWILEEQLARVWEIGGVFLVAAILQLGAQFIYGLVARKQWWWMFAALGLLFNAAGYIWYPFSSSVWEDIGPQGLIYIGYGFANTVIAPIMGDLVEIRHRSEYGQVYGLTSGFYSLGFITGTVGAGVLVSLTSFDWVCLGIAIITVLYCCTCVFFRNPQRKNIDPLDTDISKLVNNLGMNDYGANHFD
ncbi:synaptic vesicular amine transporter [Lingula anatina]|uniref:Synaptic vesicular amine transporter n=1 Tax=Lingula anatina TaxID=7574 RepID=A0A1S3JZH2_LINAN|nr:synaptic vesicular amine transporter [Lingula anatina]|eukprot:XP_013415426.1 synaptic vesicular amine transporter [Lingula anatina]